MEWVRLAPSKSHAMHSGEALCQSQDLWLTAQAAAIPLVIAQSRANRRHISLMDLVALFVANKLKHLSCAKLRFGTCGLLPVWWTPR